MNRFKIIRYTCSFSLLLGCGNISIKTDDLMKLGDEVIIETDTLVRNSIFSNSSNTHYGIDISHYQGNVIAEMSAKDSLRFVICKATQGDYYVDNDFRTNWHNIKEKGFIRGAYHFYVCADDPIKQAAHFANTISDIEATDISPILDIEQGGMSKAVSPEQMEKDILVFLKHLQHLVKRKPIIYTDYAFAQEYFKDSTIAQYDLWLAEYSGATKPKIPNLWKEKGIKIWQKSSHYKAYARFIDLDVAHGSIQNLIK
jgi:lysozyme